MKNKLYYQFAGSCLLLIFMFLSYVVRFYPQWLTGFDSSLSTFVQQGRPTLNAFFIWLTQFASSLSLGLLLVACLYYFYRRRYWTEAFWLASGIVLLGGIVNPLLKLFFQRPRPALPHLVIETSYSFPSGHSVASAVFYGALLLLLPRLLPNKKIRYTAQLLLGLMIFGIGLSRIYLGVHHPSDVLAGWCLAGAWLGFTYPIYAEKNFQLRFKNKQN